MRDEELRRELDRLIRRVKRIEDRLQMGPLDEPAAPAPAEKAEAPAPSARPTAPPPPVAATPTAEPGAKARPVAAAPSTPPTAPPTAPPTVPPTALPTGPPPRPVIATKAEAAEDRPTRPIEVFIGAKLAAWVGAVVIVIAAALFIALGFELGWWGAMSRELRCLLVAGFGVLLLIGGEAALRKFGKAASVGLFGAGLGVLYLDSYAATRFFDRLVSEPVAFGLMAVVAALGFGITLRTRFKTIGVLSLIGGYATPLLFAGTSGQDLLLMFYLTALLAVALGLSAAQPRQYRLLRYLALAFHMFVALSWLMGGGYNLRVMAVVFMSIWWCMLMLETLFAALRDQSARGNAIAVLIATAGYVTAGCWIIGVPLTGTNWLGLFTVAIALLGGAVAYMFGPGVDSLREKPRTAMDMLAIALWAQSGVLLAVAAALQFDGFGESVAWLAIGVAAIETSRHLRARSVAVFGMIVGALALARIAFLDWWITPGMDSIVWESANEAIRINQWSILALIAIAAVHAAAQRLRTEPPAHWRIMPAFLASVGAILWLALWYPPRCDNLWATGAWLLGAAILLGVERFGRVQRYLQIAIFVLVAAALKWAVIDALGARLAVDWSQPGITPLFNWQMVPVLAIVLLAWWARRITARAGLGAAATHLGGILAVCGSVFILIALSFELDRAIAQLGETNGLVVTYGPALLRELCLAGLWSLGGGALMLLGRRPGSAVQFGAGWIIIVMASLFWLTAATLGWRYTEGIVNAPVVINLQFGVGALLIVLAALATRFWLARTDAEPGAEPGALGDARQHIMLGFGLIALLGLWLGSMEIDRFFGEENTQATQGGLSVYWALYGVMLVIVGFARRAAAARYAGLALLAITVGKVLFVDLATIERIWRVVSFAVSGLLLVGTSLLYSWLSPRILASMTSGEEEGEQASA